MASTSTFDNKIAFVTGAASGIGRAVCEEMGRRGAVVVATDINQEGVEEVAAKITSAGGKAEAALLDVTRAEDVQKLVEDTASKHGRLDYIFNNAGIAVGGEVYDLSLDHWRQIIDINLWGVIYGTHAAYPIMVKQRFGHIVNVASTAGLVAFPSCTPYATTKHAVVGLSSSLREEAREFGVKVSCVCPTFIKTNIFESAVMVNASRDGLVATAEETGMGVAKAALKILRGVEKNQRIINFPAQARLFWLLHRLHPDALGFVYRRMVKEFRNPA